MKHTRNPRCSVEPDHNFSELPTERDLRTRSETVVDRNEAKGWAGDQGIARFTDSGCDGYRDEAIRKHGIGVRQQAD